MNIGERIKKCRQEAGWSQEKVAQQLGVSRQSVTKWESGQSAPSTSNLFQLAKLFGTTVDFLTKEDPPEESPKERVIIRTVVVEKKIEEEKTPPPKWTNTLRWVAFASFLVGLFALLAWFMGYTYDNFDMMEVTGYVAGFCYYFGFGCSLVRWLGTKGKKEIFGS